MTPSLISFVGVDAKTDLNELYNIQDLDVIPYDSNEPTIEWGVLISPQHAGKQNRYPSLEFAKDFVLGFGFGGIAKSVHLCGGAVDDYLFRPDSEIGFFAAHAPARLQLNFAMDKYNPDELSEIIIDKLFNERHEIILQYNKSKKKFIEGLLEKIDNKDDVPNLSILYDGSGGFGRVIDKFDPPFGEYFTGYAGGLNPENIENIVRNIGKVSNDKEYYIDMESGIRTNDFLDLEKCKKIIKIVEQLRNEKVFE